MRIAVYGAGGVGGYFGGRLAQAGVDVVFIARGRHLEAMQSRGLKVESISGDFELDSVNATDDPAKAGEVDVVIAATKAWQVEDAARAMGPMLGEHSFVVPLQNGVEAPEILARVLGHERVVGGLCGLLSYIAGPGHIRHTATPPFIKFGELDNRPSDRIKKLRQTFERAEGVRVEVPADIQAAMWTKFLFIAGWGAVGAVTRAPVGVLRSRLETREMMRLAIEEIYAVAKARGVALEPDAVDKTVKGIDVLSENGTASMQRDIISGRPSELEMQTGAVLRLGQEAGVDTPVNRFLYHSLLPMELKARGEISFD
ncbi:MAG: 2-dehydropantoate 2-reductase [Gammaproteobacteria bacterium]|nr:2-dehydropantoate 2-reductase [Gammaproteobacteria bacterium]MDH3411799.1 2-dehydropantoate 2-reductase [Gammaproteobacteria bacterium]